MRKLITIAAAVALAAFAAHAEPQEVTLRAATGTNTTASSQTLHINGYVDSVVLELPSGALTGTVAVVATPSIGDAVTIASNTITATTLVRPRFDGTGTDGSALSSDPPWRYLCYGDAIQATVTGANATGKTWRVYIKYDNGR